MWVITAGKDGKWYCEVMIQDGWERWTEDDRQTAVYKVIQAARALNNTYIREDDITFRTAEYRQPAPVTQDEEQLLKDIRTGHKKVLPYDDPMLRYRITKDEGEVIVAIREGRARVAYTAGG